MEKNDLTRLKELGELLGIDFREGVTINLFEPAAMYEVKDGVVIKIALVYLGIREIPELIGTFQGLKRLFLPKNPVSDLTPLIPLKNLKVLDIRKTDLNNLEVLSHFQKLIRFKIDSFKGIDTTPLTNLPALKYLSVSNLEREDLNLLNQLNDLKSVTISRWQEGMLTLDHTLEKINQSQKLSELFQLKTLLTLKRLKRVVLGGVDGDFNWTSLLRFGVRQLIFCREEKEIGDPELILDYFSKKDVGDLTPLLGCQHLKTLKLEQRGRDRVDLSPLSCLGVLKELHLSGSFSRLEIIQGLKNLERIKFNLHKEKVIDATIFTPLKKLRYLYLWRNEITSSAPLKELHKLEELSCRSSGDFNHFDQLSTLSALKKLSIRNFGKEYLGSVGVLTQLEELNIQGGSGEIDFLTKLTKLRSLIFLWDNITDLSPLAQLKHLKSLNIQFSGSDLTPLNKLTELRTLEISSTGKIKDLSILSGLIKLKKVSITQRNRAQISDLMPLKDCRYLESISFSRCQISDLSPLKKLKNLKDINLSDNQIEDITPLIGLKRLKYLYLSRNKISDITLFKHLHKLEQLGVSHNNLKALPEFIFRNDHFFYDPYHEF